jgi:hypothetical protein
MPRIGPVYATLSGYRVDHAISLIAWTCIPVQFGRL